MLRHLMRCQPGQSQHDVADLGPLGRWVLQHFVGGCVLILGVLCHWIGSLVLDRCLVTLEHHLYHCRVHPNLHRGRRTLESLQSSLLHRL